MLFRLSTLARQAGFRGLFAGLGPRCIMTAGLVAGQFLLYDEIKHGKQIFPFIDFLSDVDDSSRSSTGYRDPQGLIKYSSIVP